MAVYRQIAWKLRWHSADGSDRLSARPREPDDSRGRYLDVAPNPPTLVEFAEGDGVDMADLVRMGAIAAYDEPPQEGGDDE